MKSVTVVGAGFSGLTLAHALVGEGLSVRVIEKSAVPGGLISSKTSPFGLIESAANALLVDADVERLFSDFGVEYAKPIKTRKRRYIYWRRPRRWPLSLLTSLKLVKLALARLLGFKSIQPRPGESVRDWGRRAGGAQFETRLLTPALQGVYAGNSAVLSASLILNRIFSAEGRPPRGQQRGSVAPAQGMGDLLSKMTEGLRKRGVQFEFQHEFRITQPPAEPTVLCTSAWAAEEILRGGSAADVAAVLKKCESLPLISVTAFFEPSRKDRKGFGCLFPEGQTFWSLGVLFNNCIFAGRSEKRSETWIFGGAQNREVMAFSDEELLSRLLRDRQRLCAQTERPLFTSITRWPRALPHYTVQWEAELQKLTVKRPLFLHGNYLGALGLAQIYQRSKALAAQIRDLYVS